MLEFSQIKGMPVWDVAGGRTCTKGLLLGAPIILRPLPRSERLNAHAAPAPAAAAHISCVCVCVRASYDKLYLFVVSTCSRLHNSQRNPGAIIRILKLRRLRLGGERVCHSFPACVSSCIWYQNKTEIALSERTPAKLPQCCRDTSTQGIKDCNG